MVLTSMPFACRIAVALVALLHLGFLVLEMFLWTTPLGQQAFRRTAEQQRESAVLAKNQGLYNGFLAAGLLWSIVAKPDLELPLRHFFLGCVLVAGLYGAATASRAILWIQALPAAIALAPSFAA